MRLIHHLLTIIRLSTAIGTQMRLFCGSFGLGFLIPVLLLQRTGMIRQMNTQKRMHYNREELNIKAGITF